jgi:hypothetical protein
MKTTVEMELEIPENIHPDGYIYPDFSCDIRMENDGIGSYEYAGIRGYDRGQDYPEPQDEITWDQENFTDKQNEFIKSWLEKNDGKVTDKLCKKYMEDAKD